MKHLISLSLKYIRRQKLRTWLTFLCVTLAVFIFNLLAGTAGIIREAMIESTVARNGAWEVNAAPLIETKCKAEYDRREQELLSDGELTDEDRDLLHREIADLEKQLRDQIEAHLITDKSLSLRSASLSYNRAPEEAGADQTYCFFELSAGGKTGQVQYVTALMLRGDTDLVRNDLFTGEVPDMLLGGEDNLIFLPESFAQDGWKVGDSYTLTVTPVTAKLAEDSAQVTALRKKYEQTLSERPDAALFWDERQTLTDADGEEYTQQSVLPYSKLGALRKEYGFENIEFIDRVRGKSGTLELKVGGFVPDQFQALWAQNSTGSLFLSYGTDLSAFEELTEKHNAAVIGQQVPVTEVSSDEIPAGQAAPVTEESGGQGVDAFNESLKRVISQSDRSETYLTVRSGLDFDDALLQLYKDLGMNPEESDAVLHPFRDDDKQRLYNTELLSLEFRGTDSIGEWLTDFDMKFPLLITAVIVTFLLWLLMRMVIDNAFEISVQERRAQFATLRIMGASRRQVAALVCLEALFYCLAAIPLGMILAWLCAKLAVRMLSGAGILLSYHASPVLLLIFTLLAVAAVFFSAYASSMWAAKAYAPLEASKRSVLKGNRKKSILTSDIFGDPEKRAQKRAEKRARKEKALPQAPKKAKLRRTPFSFLMHYTMRNIRRTRRRFIVSVITMTVGVLLFFFGSMIGLFFAGAYAKLKDEIKTSDFRLEYMEFEGKEIVEAEQRFSSDPLYAEVRADFSTVMQLKENAGKEALGQADSEAAKLLFSQIWAGSASCAAVLVTPPEYEVLYEPLTGIGYAEWAKTLNALFVITDTTDTGESRISLYSEPVTLRTAGTDGFDLPLTGTVHLAQQDTARLKAYDHYQDGNPGACILDWRLVLPVSAVNKVDYGGISSGIRLTVRSTEDYTAAKQALQSYCAERGGESVMRLHDEFYSGTGFRGLITAVVTIAAIVLLSIWLTGILTMVNTVNTSVLNRADELMMLRTVGMTKKAVRKTVLLESVIFSGTATLIGCILGLSGAFMLFNEIIVSLAEEQIMPLAVSLLAIAAAIVLTVLLNLLIASVAARPALRTLNARMEEGGVMQ